MQPKSRLAFVDLHRGLVLLIMIEVHIFNELLMPPLKLTNWFTVLNFINGLVAPSFIFISGFAFILASKKKIDEFRKFGLVFWKQLGRILLIFIVGYSLHLTFFSLHRIKTEATQQQINVSLSVDVLQCIALGLLLLFIFRLLIKSDFAYKIFLFLAGIFFVWLAPYFWKTDLTNVLPVYVANYFNKRTGSLFPVFPWFGFMFFGGFLSTLYLKARDEGKDKNFFNTLAYVSLFFIIIGHLTLWTRSPFYVSMYAPNYFFFILRSGYVFFIFYLCKIFCDRVNMQQSLILDVSRESLLVYWLHLQIIFKKLWNDQSIVMIVNQNFNVLQCIGMTILLILLMIIAAKVWSAIKLKYKTEAQVITFLTITCCILWFLIK
jgi:uncharacterized membrane protein